MYSCTDRLPASCGVWNFSIQGIRFLPWYGIVIIQALDVTETRLSFVLAIAMAILGLNVSDTHCD